MLRGSEEVYVVELDEGSDMISVTCRCGVTSEFSDDLHNRSSACPSCGVGMWIKRPTRPAAVVVKPGLGFVVAFCVVSFLSWVLPLGALFVGEISVGGDRSCGVPPVTIRLADDPLQFLMYVTPAMMAAYVFSIATYFFYWLRLQKFAELRSESLRKTDSQFDQSSSPPEIPSPPKC